MLNRIQPPVISYQGIKLTPSGLQYALAITVDGEHHIVTWIHKTRVAALDLLAAVAEEQILQFTDIYERFILVEQAGEKIMNGFGGEVDLDSGGGGG